MRDVFLDTLIPFENAALHSSKQGASDREFEVAALLLRSATHKSAQPHPSTSRRPAQPAAPNAAISSANAALASSTSSSFPLLPGCCSSSNSKCCATFKPAWLKTKLPSKQCTKTRTNTNLRPEPVRHGPHPCRRGGERNRLHHAFCQCTFGKKANTAILSTARRKFFRRCGYRRGM